MRAAPWLLVGSLWACGAAEVGETSTGVASTSGTTGSSSGEVVTGSSTGDGLAGVGERCGQVPCEDGLYCDPFEGLEFCQETLEGTCKGPPESCPDDAGPPVCGCDGVLYASECHLRLAGVRIGRAEDCAAPEGTFPCGAEYCPLDLRYCEFTIGHGQLETYFCRELPATCESASDCECVPTASCTNPENIGGSYCEPQAGWMKVTCAPY